MTPPRALRRRPAVVAGSCLLAACAGLQSGYKPADPDVLSLTDSLPASWRDEPVVVLADSLTLEFSPPTSSLPSTARLTRVKWLYIRHESPEVARTAFVHEVEFLESTPHASGAIWRRDPDGWREVSSVSFLRRPFRSEEEYASSQYVQTGYIRDYRAGRVVRLREVHHYRRPEFLGTATFRETLPVRRKVVTIREASGTEVRAGLRNPEGLAVAETTFQEAHARVRRYEAVDLRALPAIPVTLPEKWLAAVEFSPPLKDGRSGDWKTLGDQYLALAEPFLRHDAKVAQLARSLAPAEAPASAVAESVFAHIRDNFRYHADFRSVHSFLPRTLGDILEKGWGDCKELSSLFAALMRERGFETRLALMTLKPQPQPSPGHPTLGMYNHMVAAWKDGASWRFVDATLNYGDAAASSYHLTGRTVLLLEPGNSRLEEVPVAPGWKNDFGTRTEITRAADGWNLTGRLVIEGQGAHVLYPFLRGIRGEEKGPAVNQWLEEAFGFRNVRGNLRVADWRRVEVDYAAPYEQGYVPMDKGGLVLDAPRLWGSQGRYTSHEIEGPREYEAFTQTDTWVVPREFSDLEPSSIKRVFATGDWTRDTAGYSRRYRQEARVVFPGDTAVAGGFNAERRNFMRRVVWKP